MANSFVVTAMVAPLAAPLAAAAAVGVAGWRRSTFAATVAASVLVGGCGGILATRTQHQHLYAAGSLLRADALAAFMLVVIGAVATLAAAGSDSYLRGHADLGAGKAGHRQYGVLVNLFVAAMALAVLARNLGVVWVAVEATTIATAFLVGHRRTRGSLEASWKYVVICSVGIALAFLGTVLLYFASLHAGATGGALDIDALTARAPQLDPGVVRVAAALLLLGYGTKVGLAPLHTWLADAHSEAPAPVSALMSGVLLSVAFSVLLRVKSIVDITLGRTFLRTGLVVLGLLTLAIAAALLVGQRDYKRMLAYSSLEHMGLIAVAAAAGNQLAVAALLLHVLAHGLGKSVLFLTAGHLQHRYHSTAIRDVRSLISRSPVLAASFTAGMVALLGLPPFALFASEFGIARGAAAAHLTWPLGMALVFLLAAFAALARHSMAMLVGDHAGARISIGRTAAAPLLVGAVACLGLGVSAGSLVDVLRAAAAAVGAGA